MIGGASAVLLGGVGTASARRGLRQGASAEKNIVKTAIELNTSGPYAGQFDTLIAAVVEAGLDDALSGRRQLSVFAPVDDAFETVLGIGPGDVGDVDDEELVRVLTYHVTPGRRYANSVVNAPRIPTLNGARIDVEAELLENIVATDIEASNGVIHAIDTVLLP
ncbi:fasciclin domain-containing protein [Halobellus sp. Atlit-38R]|uniref:fasciclin domain-containing protein n=1 Tax=Halobellus sp. Atlit-38R TaxID=2282131 RepID=UPI000EF1B395|nr:fasciclin domain-containing protein [Halobellus sp. Atlit-38R]RLM89692.1 fasciclin domain-containing protein [Halobellus sp. Atlit-38R]